MVDGLRKLALALHYSTPPILAIVFTFCMVVDKTFGMFSFASRKLPRVIVRILHACFVAANALAVASALFFVTIRCELIDEGTALAPHGLRFEDHPTCLPVTTLVTIVSLLFLWTDRVAIAFFRLPSATHDGFRRRVLKASAVAFAFLALSENDPFALPLLLLYGAMRPSGITRPPRAVAALKWTAIAIRVFVLWVGVMALVFPPERVSRKSAGVLVFVALSAGP